MKESLITKLPTHELLSPSQKKKRKHRCAGGGVRESPLRGLRSSAALEADSAWVEEEGDGQAFHSRCHVVGPLVLG